MGTFFGLIFGVWLIGTFICWPVFWARKTDRSQAPIVRRGIGLAYALAWPFLIVRHFMGQQERQAAEHRILGGQPPASGQHGSLPSNRAVGPNQLPLTSYGYQPPRGATAAGWRCTNPEGCGAADFTPPARWPARCPQCGWPCDPTFNEPWAQDALGIELTWQVSNDPSEYGRLYAHERLLAWNVTEALRQRNPAAASAARAALRDYVASRARDGKHWSSGFTLFTSVSAEIEAADLDGGAEDLCFWLSVSTGEGAENDNDVRTNARTVIQASAAFLAAPGGASHPRAPEIRKGCLRVAEGSYSVLTRDQQDAVTQMARA